MRMADKSRDAMERILSTTFRLLSERGYAGVSMREVAAEANVAVSQISYYFKNKSGLYTAVMERMAAAIAEEVRPCLDRSRNKRERRKAVGECMKEFSRKKPQYIRVMLDLLARSQWEPEVRARIKRMLKKLDEETASDISATVMADMLHLSVSRLLGQAEPAL